MKKICIKNIAASNVLCIIFFIFLFSQLQVSYLQAMTRTGFSSGAVPSTEDKESSAATVEEERKLPRAKEKPKLIVSHKPKDRTTDLPLRPIVVTHQALRRMAQDFDEKEEKRAIITSIIEGIFDEKYTSIKNLGTYHTFVVYAAYHIATGIDLGTTIEVVFDNKVPRGPHVDDGDSERRTALHYACAFVQVELVEYLLGRGADFEFIDGQRRGVMHYACGVHIIPEKLFTDQEDTVDNKRCVEDYYSTELKYISAHLNEKNRLTLITLLQNAYIKKYGLPAALKKIASVYNSKDAHHQTPINYATKSEYYLILEQYNKIKPQEKTSCCSIQ